MSEPMKQVGGCQIRLENTPFPSCETQVLRWQRTLAALADPMGGDMGRGRHGNQGLEDLTVQTGLGTGWTTHWNLLGCILGLGGGWPWLQESSNAPLMHSVMALPRHRSAKRQRAQVWGRGDGAPQSALGSHMTPQASWVSFLGLGPKPPQ